MWSPLFTSDKIEVVIADMPEANSRAAIRAFQFRNRRLDHRVRRVAVARVKHVGVGRPACSSMSVTSKVEVW